MTTPNHQAELLPCPFCGGKAFLRSPTLPMEADCDDVQVSCGSCDVNGPAILFDQDEHGETDLPSLEAEAIAAWNTRPASHEAELVEALITLRDYVCDAAQGALTYEGSGDGFIAMAKDDLARIEAALAKAMAGAS